MASVFQEQYREDFSGSIEEVQRQIPAIHPQFERKILNGYDPLATSVPTYAPPPLPIKVVDSSLFESTSLQSDTSGKGFAGTDDRSAISLHVTLADSRRQRPSNKQPKNESRGHIIIPASSTTTTTATQKTSKTLKHGENEIAHQPVTTQTTEEIKRTSHILTQEVRQEHKSAYEERRNEELKSDADSKSKTVTDSQNITTVTESKVAVLAKAEDLAESPLAAVPQPSVSSYEKLKFSQLPTKNDKKELRKEKGPSQLISEKSQKLNHVEEVQTQSSRLHFVSLKKEEDVSQTPLVATVATRPVKEEVFDEVDDSRGIIEDDGLFDDEPPTATEHIYESVPVEYDNAYLYQDDEHIYETIADEPLVKEHVQTVEHVSTEATHIYDSVADEERKPLIRQQQSPLQPNYIHDFPEHVYYSPADGSQPQNRRSTDEEVYESIADDQDEDDDESIHLSVKERVLRKEKQMREIEEREKRKLVLPKKNAQMTTSLQQIMSSASEILRKVRKDREKDEQSPLSSPVARMRHSSPPRRSSPIADGRVLSPNIALSPLNSSLRETAFSENEENEYRQWEEEKAAQEAAQYSPGTIPEISIHLAEDHQPLTALPDQRTHETTVSAIQEVKPAEVETTSTVYTENIPSTVDTFEFRPTTEAERLELSSLPSRLSKEHTPAERTYDLNIYDDDEGVATVSSGKPMKWDEGCSSLVIRKMSRSNRWIPFDEEDEQVQMRQLAFRSRPHSFPVFDEQEIEKPPVRQPYRSSVERRAPETSSAEPTGFVGAEVDSKTSGAMPTESYESSVKSYSLSQEQIQTTARPTLVLTERKSSLDSSVTRFPPHSYTGPILRSPEKRHSTETVTGLPPHQYTGPMFPKEPIAKETPTGFPPHQYTGPVVPKEPIIEQIPTGLPPHQYTGPMIPKEPTPQQTPTGLPPHQYTGPLIPKESIPAHTPTGLPPHQYTGPMIPKDPVPQQSPTGLPPHQYTGPVVPKDSGKQDFSRRNHYIPSLGRNFNRPGWQEVTQHPAVRSSVAPPVSDTSALPAAVEEQKPLGSLPVETVDFQQVSSPEPTSPEVSSVVQEAVASPTGGRARTLPIVNKQSYRPREFRFNAPPAALPRTVTTVYQETASSPQPVSPAEHQPEVTSPVSAVSAPSPREQESPPTAVELLPLGELPSRPSALPSPSSFSPAHSYTGTELPKSTPGGVRVFSSPSKASTKSPLSPRGTTPLGESYRFFQPSAYRSLPPAQEYRVHTLPAHSPKPVPRAAQIEARKRSTVPVLVNDTLQQEAAPQSNVQQLNASSPKDAIAELNNNVAAVSPERRSFTIDVAELSSSSLPEAPFSPKSPRSPRSPLGDYYRVFQPAAYRSPDHDFFFSEAKALQGRSALQSPPQKPVPVAVKRSPHEEESSPKLIVQERPLSQLDKAKEFSPSPLSPISPVSPARSSSDEIKVVAEVVHETTEQSAVLAAEESTKTPVPAVRKYPPVQATPVRYNPLRKMPAIERSSPSQFVKDMSLEKLNVEDSPACAQWNPKLLIDKLYEINYSPRKESKRNRFTNMEGHLDIPVSDQNLIVELQKTWAQKYFRTKDGRLQWFASHFADDHPVGEVLLSGCDVDANREEGLLSIHGGRDHVKMIIRVPPTTNLFDKWRKAINSHAASSYMDSFVHPVTPPMPHITEKVAIIELGSCSTRAGLLTMEPSLPQSFFPTVALIRNSGEIIVGGDALMPEDRHDGELVRPIQATDPSLERYAIHKPALKACLQKCVDDLHIDPTKYRVLLSIPQNIPTVLIPDILKIVLEELRFKGIAISRQPSLILYAYDVTTGVVVDIGDRLNIVPVIDGYVVDSAVVSLPYGALQITNALQSKLAESNMGLYSFKSPTERLILRYVMEQVCYVASDFEDEVKRYTENENSVDVIVSLDEFKPTSEMQSTFMINSARFTAPEGLFKPKRWGLDTKALHQLVHEAVQLSPIDSRKTLLRNIYLAGGASLLPGLAERLEIEVSSLVATSIHTQVHVSPWRYNAAYLGAQIVASSTQFDDTCVTLDTLSQFITQLQSSTF